MLPPHGSTRHSHGTNALFPVIEAYSRSLRLVFISAIAMFVIVNALVSAIDLPRLRKKEASSEDGEDNEE